MISVITPCLNEAENLGNRRRELGRQGVAWEWIVVDGGSEDATVEVARSLGACVVHAPRGRGTQLNAGAREARGDILLFLHADTEMPPDGLRAVRRLMSDAQIWGGNFRIRFSGDHWESRALEVIYRIRQRLLGVYYGDSTIFVRRDIFWQLGGFPDQKIMEDHDFVRRLERAGRTQQLDQFVISSDRRYRGKLGRWLFRWASVLLLYRLGVPADRLAVFYPTHKIDGRSRPAGSPR